MPSKRLAIARLKLPPRCALHPGMRFGLWPYRWRDRDYDGCRPGLHSHGRRIRRGADDRRQHPRPNQSSLSIPVFYVSHDISEIERLADYMVLLDKGRVVATGVLGDILADSRLPIARSPEASTVLEATVKTFDATDGLTTLGVHGECLFLPGRVGDAGSIHRVLIVATDVSLSVERPSLTSIPNVVPAKVRTIHPVDDVETNVVVTIGHGDEGPKLLARITRRAVNMLDFAAVDSFT